MIRFFLLVVIFPFLLLNLAYTASIQEDITASDKILVIAPHPDDEILATGGIIQKVIKKKAAIKVAYITNGEHNLLSLFLRHKLFLKDRKRVIGLGKVRKKESIDACEVLGLSQKNLIFLGYPDSGILNIFLNHWGSQKPFEDSLSQLAYTRERGGIPFSASYKGENILKDLETIIINTKPTKIFIPSPYDTNEDHIGSYLFSKVALLSLEKVVAPKVYLYIVHRGYFSIFERHSYETYMNLPQKANLPDNSLVVNLSHQEKLKKREAILRFKTQMYCKKFLLSFAQNEIFNEELPPVVLGERQHIIRTIRERKKTIARIIFTLENNLLKGEIVFIKKIDIKEAKGKIYLFGYKSNVRFEKMPKTYLSFRENKWNVYNQDKKIVKTKNLSFKINENNCIFTIPITLVGEPDYIFISMDMSLSHYNVYLPWELIKIQKFPLGHKISE